MSVLARNAVTVSGRGDKPMIFVHGYGCDQTMWRFIAPRFEASYRVVMFDLTGSGRSDLGAYDKHRYASLHGFADDLIELCEELDLKGAQVCAHSVGCMITLLAARKRPDLFERIMLLGPSPCYLNLPGYGGGFDREGIDELLAFLEINLEAWSAHLAPMVMGNADRPELAEELQSYYCSNDPDIAHHFAKVLFLSDHRADLADVKTPCLIMQCCDDVICPMEVGDFMHSALSHSELVVLSTEGHYPQFSAPDAVAAAILTYLDGVQALAA